MRKSNTLALLERSWVLLSITLACVVGGYGVYGLSSISGRQEEVPRTDKPLEAVASTKVKRVTYELFGTTSSTGTGSYLDDQAQPQEVSFTGLPWSHTITTTALSMGADIIAQGDGDELGCRILVDDQVRDEQSSTMFQASTSCLVDAA